MRILFVTPFFAPQTGGVATFLDDARRFLEKGGHEVYVLRTGEARSIEPCPQNNDEHVYELYLRSPWVERAPVRSLLGFSLHFVPTLWKLARFVRQKRVQLVCLEYPLDFSLYFLALRAWTGMKLMVGLHGDDILSIGKLPGYERAIVKRVIRRADWVLAHSASLLQQVNTIITGLGNHQSYLPYGIDCERLRSRAANSALPGSAARGRYVLTVAKLYDRKGIDILLRAIEKVRGSLGDVRFLIVGDGPEEAKLKGLAMELGVAEHVVFAGDVPNHEIPRLFQECQFFVLPSRSEPFGIVLLEAMTFGKAILATRVGGIPEFVTDGCTGVLVPSEDPEALARQLLVFLRDPEYVRQIGKNGIAVAENVYDYRVVIKKYEALLDRVVQGAPTSPTLSRPEIV